MPEEQGEDKASTGDAALAPAAPRVSLSRGILPHEWVLAREPPVPVSSGCSAGHG